MLFKMACTFIHRKKKYYFLADLLLRNIYTHPLAEKNSKEEVNAL